MKKIRFSVVTVCLNAEESIEATINSIISQYFNLFEFIVVDGGSTDSTLEILEKYRGSISKLISEPDAGIYNAMNKGAEIATGDYIIYMNANDIFYNSDVLTRIDTAIGSLDYALIYGDYLLNIGSNRYYVSAASDCKGQIPTSHQAIFCNAEKLRKIRFSENYILAADYNLINELWKIGANLKLSIPICIMESIGLSSNRKGLIIHEHFRINKIRYGFSFALYKAFLSFSSMQIANMFSALGMSWIREFMRRFKGWRAT